MGRYAQARRRGSAATAPEPLPECTLSTPFHANIEFQTADFVPDFVDVEVSTGDEDGPWVHTVYSPWTEQPLEVAGDAWYRVRGVTVDLVPQTQYSNVLFVG